MPMIINPYLYTSLAAEPTYRSAGTGVGSGATTVGYPSGLVSGDALYVHIVAASSEALGDTAAAISTPSGFTSVTSTLSVSGTTPNRLWRRSTIYKKTGGATGSESGSLSISASMGIISCARMYAFVGGSDNSEGGGGDETAATGTTISQRTLTTTGDSRLGLHFVYANSNTTIGPFTGETGGDWTEAVGEYSGSGTLQLQVASLSTATTISGGSATLGATSTFRIRQALAIYG